MIARRVALGLAAAGLSMASAIDLACLDTAKADPQVYLAPFYAATATLNPNGKPLGTVLASEPVAKP